MNNKEKVFEIFDGKRNNSSSKEELINFVKTQLENNNINNYIINDKYYEDENNCIIGLYQKPGESFKADFFRVGVEN
ncbi:MAG: hypothetical protein ACOCV1_06600, partial [Bacillota bacterium]